MPVRPSARVLRPRVVLVASTVMCLTLIVVGTLMLRSRNEFGDPKPALIPVANPSPSSSAPLGWGPTEGDLAAGIATAKAMSLDQVAGQVIVARYTGTNPAAAAELIRSGFGGLILFSENVAGVNQVLATTAAIQQAQAATHRDWPAIVGVDQEGGTVQRLGSPWTAYPNFVTAGAAVQGAGGPAVVTDAYAAQARELRAGGFNVNFAPDADVISPSDTVIGPRSAGSDPAVVSAAVTAALAGLRSAGVLGAVKHFPGHGDVGADSHLSLPVQKANQRQLEARDLAPFTAAIKAGTPMVMVGHIAVQAWDAGTPASLSPAAYRHLRQAGFTGVAITDGLDMDAVTKGRDSAQIAVQAIAAGADLLLTPMDPINARQGLIDAVKSGALPRQRLNEAAGRVITMMRWQQRQADRLPNEGRAALGTAAAPAAGLSAAAVTDLSASCQHARLTGPVHFTGGTEAVRTRMGELATSMGIQVSEAPDAASVELVTESASGPADAAISLGEPRALAQVQAPIKIAAYDSTDAALSAALRVLVGAPSPGRLPAPVGSLAVGYGCS